MNKRLLTEVEQNEAINKACLERKEVRGADVLCEAQDAKTLSSLSEGEILSLEAMVSAINNYYATEFDLRTIDEYPFTAETPVP